MNLSDFCIALDEGGMDDPRIKKECAHLRKIMSRPEPQAHEDAYPKCLDCGKDMRTLPYLVRA